MALSLTAAAAEQKWNLAYDKHGVQVFTRSIDGSSFKEFRAEIVADEDLASIVSLLWTTGDMPKWMHGCKKAELKETVGELNRKLYLLNSAPFPLKDRDLVIQNVVTQDPATLNVRYSMDLVAYPLDTPYVKVPRMNGFVELVPEGPKKTKVIYQAHLEAGGIVPGWAANVIVTENPLNTLKNARELLQKVQYPDYPGIKNKE